MTDRVSITVADHVADVRLTRGDKMNALDFAMFDALTGAINRLKAEKSLRVVVLHGEGKAFCAGLDMGRMVDLETATEVFTSDPSRFLP